MKNIKQIRENYDLITEKEDADTRKLTSLVRAGLFDAKKLSVLKRAMEKSPDRLTTAERKILIELLNSLMSEVLHSQQVYSKVRSNVSKKDDISESYLSKYDSRYQSNLTEKDLPSVILLKRKAIRIFPGRQKVGLNYSQSLDRYISIPFGPGTPSLNEETITVNTPKKDDEDDYDAPKKEGKRSNLTKAWLKGKVQTPEYLGAKIGAGLEKIFRRKKSASKVAPTPASKSTPVKKLTKKQEIVLKNVQARKKSAIKTGESSKESGITDKQKQTRKNTARRYASYAQMDRRKAGLEEEHIDEAGPALIPLAIGAARLGSAVAKGYRALQASRAARAASKAAKQTRRKQDPKRTQQAKERLQARKNRDAKRRDIDVPGGTGSDTASTVNEPKFTQAAKYQRKINISSPKPREVRTGYDVAADAKYRKSLSQPVSESIKMIAEGNYESYDIFVGKNNVSINTTIAKKLMSLYESLNSNNKKQMKNMLNEGSIESFKKIIDFAIRQQ
jgi:hypothetical protein